MRIVLLADGNVGEEINRFLLKNYPQDLVLVVSMQKNDIFRDAESIGIPVCVFDSEKKILERLNGIADLGLLAWWPKILKNQLLNAPLNGFINMHPSLLPYNRGKHYNFWALVEQTPFGVTLHRVDSGIDTGEIIAQSTIKYDWTDTGGTLYAKAQKAIVKLFIEAYPLLRMGLYNTKPQDSQAGSFHLASELEAASRIDLDSNYKARNLLNLLRARTFKGHPGCWFVEDGHHYEISVTINRIG
jgi:methionyl-tRNA formyltransferase